MFSTMPDTNLILPAFLAMDHKAPLDVWVGDKFEYIFIKIGDSSGFDRR